MEITHEVERMKKVACPKGHGPAELPQEGNWTQVKEIRDISGLSHGIGWCAPQQGCCKLTLNVKNGVIQEALVETTGCTGATHGAAVAGEHLPGKTLLEALNTHLGTVCIIEFIIFIYFDYRGNSQVFHVRRWFIVLQIMLQS